jgi:RHS repeat-associated protein
LNYFKIYLYALWHLAAVAYLDSVKYFSLILLNLMHQIGGIPKGDSITICLVSPRQIDAMQVGYTYDNALRITKKNNYVLHSEINNAFDANGVLSSIYYHPQSGYPSNYYPSGRLNFTRDASGLISTIDQDLAMTINYDPDLQISSIAHTLPQPFDEAYTYDSNGNRLTSLTNSYTYDNLNRLTASTINDYTYDADGNMTQEKNKLTGETKKYYYDSENRMIKYEHLASDISPVDTTAIYKYDIYGRRIQKNVNDTITNFMWEGDNLSFELNSANQPIRKYFSDSNIDDYWGHLEYSEVTNWQRLFEDSYPQGWYSYIKDQVGTIYKVWDQNTKQIVDNRTYDSFGNLINQSGSTKTPLGFQGKYYDAESGLNYFYHRYYNPAIGRFTSEDPIGLLGGLNMYEVMGNDAINSIDPFGLVTGSMTGKTILLTWEEFRIRANTTVSTNMGKTVAGEGSGINFECIQGDNGKWYQRFNMNFNSEFLISITNYKGELYSTNEINAAIDDELRHFNDLNVAYGMIWDALTEKEKNGFSSECECKNQAGNERSKALRYMKFQSFSSVLVRDCILYFYYKIF